MEYYTIHYKSNELVEKLRYCIEYVEINTNQLVQTYIFKIHKQYILRHQSEIKNQEIRHYNQCINDLKKLS